MITLRLYYQDSHLKEFSAAVLSCTKEKEGYLVALDQTAFYPEGGGQPGDIGFLDDVRVTDTRLENGEIVHLCEKPLAVGSSVRGRIDWERRFSYMQLHSGEHIVSGIIHRRFGYENVGFHMGAEMMTIDLSGMMTMDELREIEKEANEAVWSNIPVQISYLQEGEKTEYRSKKELSGEIRLVTIPGFDVCACCGTHVKNTGEIGLIKLFTCQKFHEGVRVEMLCGRMAYDYVNQMVEQNHRNSALLSAKPEQTSREVERVLGELADVKYRLGAMERTMIENKAKELTNSGDCVIFGSFSADGLRQMADSGMKACGGQCAVFSGNDADGYRYAIGEKNGDLRMFGKALNTALRGRGGGKPEFLQGSVQATRQQIEAFFTEED